MFSGVRFSKRAVGQTLPVGNRVPVIYSDDGLVTLKYTE